MVKLAGAGIRWWRTWRPLFFLRWMVPTCARHRGLESGVLGERVVSGAFSVFESRLRPHEFTAQQDQIAICRRHGSGIIEQLMLRC